MPVTWPVKPFFETERDRRKDLRDRAQQDLTDAQKAVATSRTILEARTAALAAKLREIADLRRQIAAAPMPADMDQRLEELRTALIDLRSLRSELLTAQEALAGAEADEERARAASQAAGASLAEAEQAVARETERRERLDRWLARLEEEPLFSLHTRAADAQGSPLFLEAQATTKEIPDALRLRALDRLDRELKRQSDEQAAATVAEDDLSNLASAEVARAWEAFRREEASLGAWVNGAPARLDQALGLLERAKGATLTADEKAYLATIDAAVAVGLEKERDDALKARDDANDALEAKKVGLLADDIDKLKAPEKLAEELNDENEALGEATLKLELAESAFDPVSHDLETWEAAVPDAVWDGLAAFARARRILEKLATGPGDPIGDLFQAETVLANILTNDLKRGRTIDFLRARAERLRGRLLHAENLREPRIAHAVRGDA